MSWWKVFLQSRATHSGRCHSQKRKSKNIIEASPTKPSGHCFTISSATVIFSLDNYRAYDAVNRRFAEVTAGVSTDEDTVWIHDYQLISSGWYLRQLHPYRSLAFFLHIPFPSPDLYRRLPWGKQLLMSLLAYDLVGFQTLRDHRNFIHCVTSLIKGVEVRSRHRSHTVLRYGDRFLKVGHFPISIDFNDFAERSKAEEVSEAAWYLHENYEQRQLILGH